MRKAFEHGERFDLHSVRLCNPELARREVFSGLDMAGVLAVAYDFHMVTLERVRFDEAYLDRANFDVCLMPACLFRAAHMRQVSCIRSVLTGSDFTGAMLEGAALYGAQADHCLFTAANARFLHASGVALDHCSFEGADLTGADFRGARLTCANFTRATLTNARFDGAYLDGADWTNAMLDGSDLERVANERGIWRVEWAAGDGKRIPPVPTSWRNHPYNAEISAMPVPEPLSFLPDGHGGLPDFPDDETDEKGVYKETTGNTDGEEEGDIYLPDFPDD